MYQTIALQLKTLRKKHRLTQAELASRIGVTTRSLGRYEKQTHFIGIYPLHCLNCQFQTTWSDWLNTTNEPITINYHFPSEFVFKATDEKTFYSVLGQRIAYLRKIRGLSQRELSKQLGISDRAIAHYEEAERRLSLDTLIALANELTITPYELLHEL